MIVKVCGLCRLEDAALADAEGADLLGFIFAPSSKRLVTAAEVCDIIKMIPDRRSKVVGVFQDQSAEFINEVSRQVPLDYVQLHGSEDPSFASQLTKPVIRVVSVEESDTYDTVLQKILKYNGTYEMLLLDTKVKGQSGGGAGVKFDWDIARRLLVQDYKFLVAGGLNTVNLPSLLATKPFGVDVSSGVEAEARIKDTRKLVDFINIAKNYK
ncbi:hypothetical protein MP638_006137 [Amoeboaphelidium occidentale]|nr:hypothetical protein MP638_006137 [Amoeboaphelidium occidentale]